jgi:multimeric flavodoxin WrbA
MIMSTDQNMSELVFTEDARASLDVFLSSWPIVARGSFEQKILRTLDYYRLQGKARWVTKEILIAALEETFPSFEVTVLRTKDQQALLDTMKAQKKVHKRHPLIKIKRWDLPAVTLNTPMHDVCALLAGPRIGGNTDCILDALIDGVRGGGAKVEKLKFPRLSIAPCNGCLACDRKELTSFCAIKDDMTYLYRRLLECDVFILGFPIYTARECSQVAIFFDRLKALGGPKQFVKVKQKLRKGALVVTWGWPSELLYKGVVENTAFLLRHFGVEVAEIVTGSGFWDAYYAKGTALLDKKGLAQARAAGKALVSS